MLGAIIQGAFGIVPYIAALSWMFLGCIIVVAAAAAGVLAHGLPRIGHMWMTSHPRKPVRIAWN